MSPEQIKTTYEARIRALLDGIASQIRDGDPTLQVSEIDEMFGDDYRWSLLVQTAEQAQDKDDLQGVDVTFVICESELYDGEENGVNFAVEIVGVGGEIIGGLTPYNYTERCWVSRDDSDAVEERFQLVEHASPGDAAYLIAEFLKGK